MMGVSCADPSLLEGLAWLSCYLMTGKHMAFYLSFLTVLILLAITAPVAIIFGLLGAVGSRARLLPVRLLGRGYISVVRFERIYRFNHLLSHNYRLICSLFV